MKPLLYTFMMHFFARPWKEAMEVMTGEGEMSTKALREYFQPLGRYQGILLASGLVPRSNTSSRWVGTWECFQPLARYKAVLPAFG
jgi:hypothetical protein